MENSFLKRSSLALGFLLAASSIAAAETSPSTFDDPAVLQKLLGMVADKAKSDAKLAPGNAEALNDPKVLEKLLHMVQKETPPASSAFDNPAMMEKLLSRMAQMGTEKSYMADEVAVNTSSALDGASVMQGLLPLVGVSAVPRTAEIFEPIPRTFDFSDGIPEQKALIGMSLGQQTSAEYGDSLLFGGSVRYHLTDRLDALASIDLGLTSFGNQTIKDDNGNTELKEHAAFRVITAGIGYSLLKGITSIDGETFLPWQLNVDGVIGEQFTGSSHGMYLGVGTSLQVMMGDYWIGTDTRYYHVDDEVLNQEGSHRGLQWSIAVGFYY
ncbi:hypothetical protein [Oceanobacter antarcticus]|jgi:hypothetical protein|uniref:Outer membrane protein beta-barrel domain-containing protein n=1 Tax=Oceanobacter antarcticus TaxID=3133425 RepID=A0ABW8NKZ0_9GAMM